MPSLHGNPSRGKHLWDIVLDMGFQGDKGNPLSVLGKRIKEIPVGGVALPGAA